MYISTMKSKANNATKAAKANIARDPRAPAAASPLLVTPGRLAIAVVLLAIVFFLPQGGRFLLSLANTAAITAIGAMGLTVLIGTAGLLSLGQAAFLAIGAFTAALLVSYTGAGFLVALLAAGVCAALIGIVIAAATARTAGIYLAVGTLALQFVVELLLTDVEVKLTAALGFQMEAPELLGLAIDSEKAWWFLLCALMFAIWLALRWIVRGQSGRNWVCMREHAAVANSLGISVIRSRMAVFALSSFIAGIAGALHGYYIGTVQITNYSLHLSIVYLTVVVLGRLGSIGGAIWAAAFITALPHMLSWLLRALGVDVISRGAGVENIALGLILMLVLLRVPRRVLALVRNGVKSGEKK